MKRHLLACATIAASAVLSSAALAAPPAVTVLTTFNGRQGTLPYGMLAGDGAGNLYGTTVEGGLAPPLCSRGCGTVFKLSPPIAGQTSWTRTTLSFFNGNNGSAPYGGLIRDAAGNLYGTTNTGGPAAASCPAGCGTVFRLSPPAAGQTSWTRTVLAFFHGPNGLYPAAGLLADAAGNLYGATGGGGAKGHGTVFRLTPPVSGKGAWSETVLASFDLSNGSIPTGSLIADKAGRLYGTTTYGGAFGNGTAFRLDPPVSGGAAWTVAVLASFDWAQGATPVAGLVADAKGVLYGTTLSGGTYGLGTVFELTPPAPGRPGWTQTALVSFGATTGVDTYGGVLIGKAGKLYGTTYQNGPAGGGSVFELAPPASAGAPWSQSVLAAFDGANGANPNGGLLADSAGDLYGTTGAGGPSNNGTVFRVTP